MQMTGATGTPGNKSPPPPMVQQSVGDSAGHSRNVSQGSAKSQQQQPPLTAEAAAVDVVLEGQGEGGVHDAAEPTANTCSNDGLPEHGVPVVQDAEQRKEVVAEKDDP